MNERLARLEARCDELEKTLAALAARLEAAAPAATITKPAPAAPAALPGQPGPDLDPAPLVGTLTDLGRSLLVLGGAFLIRALTDSGAVPRAAGIALGLAYAIGWIALADRVGGQGRRRAAALFGATAVLIAAPLAVETATRFAALPAWGSAAVIVVFTALALGVSVRRDLQALAWVAALFGLAALTTLFAAASAAAPAALGMLAIGILTNALADSRRAWSGPRWPAAAAADLFAGVLAWLVSRQGGLPEAYAGLSSAAAFSIALALPLAYFGAAVLRTLRGSRDVSVFDAVQSPASLAIGLGAATAAAGASTGGVAIGAAGLILSAACYAVTSRLQARPAHFTFYASLGLGLALFAGWLFFSAGPLAAFWAALGLVAALVSTRRNGSTLPVHAAIYLAAAALASGLLAAAVVDFFGSEAAGVALSPWAFAVLGASAAATLAMAGGSPLPRLVTACVTLAGAGALAVFVAVRLAGGLDPGWRAAARTGVLAVSAILLAALWRSRRLPELRWLAYAALAAGAVKILVQDVPQGRAASLVAALALYGLALIVAPRWLKTQ